MPSCVQGEGRTGTENSGDAFVIETNFSNWMIELISIGDFISRMGYIVPTVRNDERRRGKPNA
jgi:hypothetical protein